MMTDIEFETLDISDMEEDKIGEEIEKRLMGERLTVIEDKKVGYKGFLVPDKYINIEHLLQYIKAEPMIGPLEEYAKDLTSQLGVLKSFFGVK
jgi:hypothetical protein